MEICYYVFDKRCKDGVGLRCKRVRDIKEARVYLSKIKLAQNTFKLIRNGYVFDEKLTK